MFNLREIDPGVAELEDGAKTTKKFFLQFIRDGQAHLVKQCTEKPAASAPTAAQIHKKNRVERYEAETLINLDQVANEIEVLFSSVPQKDRMIKDQEERFSNYSKKAEMILKEGTSLCSDAVDTGLELQATALESGIRKVRSALIDGQTQLGETKARAGLFGSTNHFKSSDIKPPSFSGDEEGSADYFSFHKEYFEFADSREYTNIQHLHTLKKTCLVGTAKLACMEMESVEEIFKYLKRTYGNPNLLLAHKIGNIRKLGACPPANDKKREWLIKVQQQLKYLIKLATEHKILAELHHSDLMNTIHLALPYKAQTLFRENIEQMDWGEMTRAEVFEETVTFLDMQVNKATSDIKLNLLLGINGNEKNKTFEKPKANTRPAQGRTYQVTLAAETEANPEEEGPNPSQQSQQEHVAAAAGSSHAAVPQPHYTPPKKVQCKLCPEKHEYLYYCDTFQKTRVNHRFQMTRTMKTCVRCLRSDSDLDSNNRWDWWKKHEINCSGKWTCKVSDCKDKSANYQYHFTMCTRHIRENKLRSDDFLKALDQSLLKTGARFFFNKNLNFHSNKVIPPTARVIEPNVEVVEASAAPAIFMLQEFVAPGGEKGLIFYDSGCSTSALSDRAVSILPTEVVTEGPTKMGVAGGGTLEIPGGERRFWLRTTTENQEAAIIGTHMPDVTTAFPVFKLTEAFNYVYDFHQEHGDPRHELPQVPQEIGGAPVDVMIGIQNNRFFPKLELFLPCGLALYTALFQAPGGKQGVLGGPHSSWLNASNSAQMLSPTIFFTSELRAVRYQADTLKSLITDFQHLEDQEELCENHGLVVEQGENEKEEMKVDEEVVEEEEEEELNVELAADDTCTSTHCNQHSKDFGWSAPVHWDVSKFLLNLRTDIDQFENLEDIGTEVSYRCLRCRNCSSCRNGETLEKTSLEEEKDQALLEASVWFNPTTGRMEAKLPFKQDPVSSLKNNRGQAEKMLQGQLRSIAKKPGSKEDVLRAHNKLRDKGHVISIEDLSPEEKKIVTESLGAYWIPWSVVFKPGSLSSPSRVVFNASMKTATGQSLNSILAKGINKLPKILDLLNRFGLHCHAFTGDISMAYNMVKLSPSHYTYQRYLWAENLDVKDKVVDMVVRTLIYGVTPSGGLMTAGFAAAANHTMEHQPEHTEGALVLKNSSYVDDVLHAAKSLADCHRISRSLDVVLKSAGMQTKGFTFSGSPPPEAVSADEKSIGVLGYVWWPEDDIISLAAKDLSLGKSSRGRAPTPVSGDLKDALRKTFTRRVLSGKVCGVYDPKGLVTPITSRIKLCLSEVIDLKIGWDDQIPERYLDAWVKNIMDIQQLCNIRFKRSYVHPDAVSDKVDLLVSVDASKDITVATIHARTLLNDGSYNCNLICAKSKLVHMTTVPRAELRGAVLGATLAHAVKQSIGEHLGRVIFVTDSTIVLHWLHQDSRPLHTLVRNSVIEVRRLSSLKDWHHVESAFNIADLGTRNCEIEEIGFNSEWQNGMAWMKLPVNKMPIRTMEEVNLSQAEKREAAIEVRAQEMKGYMLTDVRGKVADRHRFSRYLVNPCLYPWPKSVRIMGFVLKFVNKCKLARLRQTALKAEIKKLNSSKIFVDESLDDEICGPSKKVCNIQVEKKLEKSDKKQNEENMENFISKLRPDAPQFAPERFSAEKLPSSASLNPFSVIDEIPKFSAFPPDSEYNCLGLFAAKCSKSEVDVGYPVVTRLGSTRMQVPPATIVDSTEQTATSARVEEDHVTNLDRRREVNKQTHGEEIIEDQLTSVKTLAQDQLGEGDSEDQLISVKTLTQDQLMGVLLSVDEKKVAENYFFRKSANEVIEFSKKEDYKHCSEFKEGILYHQGRILEGQEIDDPEQVMTDLNPLSFIRPICDRWSPVAYSVMLHCHESLVHHRNAAATLRESRSIVYVLKGRDLANEVRESCNFCRRFKARLLQVEMGNIHKSRLRISPPFFTAQCDLFGPYEARCEHNHRSKVLVWGVLFKCPASGALSACAMSRYNTGAFLQAYGRHAYRYGHPAHLYVDAGSQILKACREMELSYADIVNTLNAEHDVGMQHTVAPVLGHNQIGMVERSVQEVKKLFNRVFVNLRLDSLSYETAFQFAANELNSLPICLGSRYKNLDHTDLITPSRLILGRNNRRAPAGYTRVESFSRQVQDLDNVYRSWWKVWKQERLAEYIPRPNKWTRTSREPEVGDIVVYLQEDKEVTLGKTLWRLGRVAKVVTSADNGKRQLNIQYKNATEEKFRDTWRSTRKVAIIHREGDLEMLVELNKAAEEAAINMHVRINKDWRCKSTFCASVCIDSSRHSPNVDVQQL